jgi:hypothetical protein
MPIDAGTAIVIGAVLIFYLRLIILQRERAKRARQASSAAGKGKKGGKAGAQQQFSILSPNLRDRIIGGAGVVAILAGILLNRQMLPWEVFHTYWWLPTALGIIAFSWAFR